MRYSGKAKSGKKYLASFIIVLVLAILFGFLADFIIEKIEFSVYKKPEEYVPYVSMYSEKYDVPEHIIYSVIKAESGFDELAKSSAGALGLMQMMPGTFEYLASSHFGENCIPSNLYDPEISIKYGTYYLSYLYERYGNWTLAFAAYNAGPGNVDEWLSDKKYSSDGQKLDKIPFKETKKYVSRVNRNIEKYDRLYNE